MKLMKWLRIWRLLKIARKTQQFQAFQLIFPSFRYVQLDFPNQHTRQTIQRWRTIYSISFYGRIMLWMDATVSKGLFISSLCFTIDGKHMFYFEMGKYKWTLKSDFTLKPFLLLSIIIFLAQQFMKESF